MNWNFGNIQEMSTGAFVTISRPLILLDAKAERNFENSLCKFLIEASDFKDDIECLILILDYRGLLESSLSYNYFPLSASRSLSWGRSRFRRFDRFAILVFDLLQYSVCWKNFVGDVSFGLYQSAQASSQCSCSEFVFSFRIFSVRVVFLGQSAADFFQNWEGNQRRQI